jgi:hypothetical protein
MLGPSSLAGWKAVLASIAAARRTPDERDTRIERSGLYGEYPAIVRASVEHFSDPDTALEDLKRAYFLVWCGAMAAPAESRIAPLARERGLDAPTGRIRDVASR